MNKFKKLISLDEDVLRKVEALAIQENRTGNAQIEYMVKQKLKESFSCAAEEGCLNQCYESNKTPPQSKNPDIIKIG